MVVFGDARFAGQGQTLTGATISLVPSGPASEEVVARHDARLAGSQVDMRAPAIRLFVEGGSVDRLVALSEVPPAPGGDDGDGDEAVDTLGLSPGDAQRARDIAGAGAEEDQPPGTPDSLPRPSVVAQDFHLSGDSIDVRSPGQRLQQVVAVGGARAESAEADSLDGGDLPDILRRDWMVGDTIVARFGTPSATDSAPAVEPAASDSTPRLETLTAIGEARSFYRMYSSDTTSVGAEVRPALHLVEGAEITIYLDGREVVNMDVAGQTDGWHFEPQAADSAVAASAGAAPDSAAADTAAADTSTTRAPDADSTLRGTGLTKVYKKRAVVQDVDIEVRQGEVVGLLGPNGAGKTTTFYMLVGLIGADRGKVHLDDTELTDVPMYRRARMGVGYLAQEPSVFRRLTVAQNVMAILETLDLTRAERLERLDELLSELSMGHLRNSKAFSLSGGERRRLEITRALVQRPKFMLLDEPFAGIDPIAVQDIQEIVSQLGTRNIGVIISDHNVEQTLEIVDRACIMHDGQIRVAGTVSELVWNDEVAHLYLGRTLTARMRSRFPLGAE